ncbi:MAG: methyltransferase domain-containing protein, partial [candidate division WOR-3 bacterium]
LPEETLDFVFMRNVTHHIKDRTEYFKNLINFLKPDGRFVVIEYDKGKPISFRRLFGHHVPKEVIIKEMGEVGFALEKDFDFLPEQHFCIFMKAEGSHST